MIMVSMLSTLDRTTASSQYETIEMLIYAIMTNMTPQTLACLPSNHGIFRGHIAELSV